MKTHNEYALAHKHSIISLDNASGMQTANLTSVLFILANLEREDSETQKAGVLFF